VYASYTDIFKPQLERTFAGEQLEPRTGNQYEAGIKGEFREGLLNASVGVFRIIDENRALADPDNLGYFLPVGKVRTQGAETELTGRIAPNWNLTAGYAYNQTKYLKAAVNQQGQAFSTLTPKHTFDLWTHYTFAGDFAPGLEAGFGARAVSEFYSQSGGVNFVADGYAIFSSQVAYTLAGRHKIALNIENLLDKKYYEKVSGFTRQNYYGTPRSVMLTVRSRF
jgi:outer membrane receptor for ferric coprogen and ferric-rhodotorulic acid